MIEDWRLDALCAQVDPDAFFPESTSPAHTAKKICSMCRVRPECLNYALENNETEGVWGGKSPRERQALRPAPSWSVVRAVEVRRLADSGLSDEEIAERMECHPRTVRRIRVRHGIEGRAA